VAFNYDEYANSSLNRYFIDIDEKELQKYTLGKDKKINVDIADFFDLISNISIDTKNNQSKLDWLEQCKSEKKSKHILNYHVANFDYVSTYILIDKLSDLIDSDLHTLIPGSSGSCSDIFMQTFRTKGSVCIQNAPGLGAMGTGLPAILGAAAARPDTQIISIIGDGGFQFNLQELQTIKNREINCAIFVLNNDGYASIRRSQLTHFKRKAHADKKSNIKLSNLDLVAKCFGFKFYNLEHNKQIPSLLNEILNINGQIIIEVIVDPNEDVRPRVGARIVEGKIKSANLKDYK
jgi:acetolactate synthase-1/2/3 large subunit